jgi:MATE family multidrug resistance protein
MQVLIRWWAYLRPLDPFDPAQGPYWRWLLSGELPQDAMGTLYRVLLGFLIGAGLALPLGLAMAITVRVGNAVGRGDERGVRYAGFCGIGLTLATQLFSAGLMLGMPHAIASLYTHDPKVIALAVQLIMLAGLFQFSDGIQVAANGALRGLKDTRVPMIITLFAYWVIGMPVGWWLAFHRGMGARGMWVGLIAGLSVAALMLFVRFWRSAWKQRWRSGPITAAA